MAMDAYHFIVIAVLHSVAVESQNQAVLNVQNVIPGETATFECSSSSITSTSSLEITKDSVLIYNCGNIAFTCSALSADNDYSDVTFTGKGTTSGKGTFTVDNADQTRDGGDWTCTYDTSSTSTSVTFCVGVTSTSTSTSTTVPPKRYFATPVLGWLMLIALVVLACAVVIFIVYRNKTLVISKLYVKVTKNTVQLSCKLKCEPIPNTTYAECAKNGLKENAEFIDGMIVVEFRHLNSGRQHDVTIYCQNAADKKLYKSETFVVFTLKDCSNTNPKESTTVFALHLLELVVYKRKVELSWTSPIALDSTKVEYWVGCERHTTIYANNTSIATSNAKMTTLLPERMITFTITGEKDGTKYPSGILHQKTLKGLTGCCP